MANRVTRWSGTEPRSDAGGDRRAGTGERRVRLTARGRFVLALLAVALGVGGTVVVRGLSGDLPTATDPAAAAPPVAEATPSPRRPVWEAPTPTDPPAQPALAATPSGAVATATTALYHRAPVAVVAPEPEQEVVDQDTVLAAWLALRLQAPLLYAGPGLPRTLRQLGTSTVVTVGLDAGERLEVAGVVEDLRTAVVAAENRAIMPLSAERPDRADPAAPSVRASWPVGLRSLNGPPVTAWLEEVRPLLELAARAPSPSERSEVAQIARLSDPSTWAVSTTAASVGIATAVIDGPDPRVDPTAVTTLAGRSLVLVAGTHGAWGDRDPETFAWQLETATTGVQLPGGGQTLFPGKLLVALYGHPDGGALGVLGEQPVEDAIERAIEVADAYREVADETVVPTFEVIATVASRGPGPAGDYSRRTPLETLRPWIDAAGAAGVYVVLDLQPGRTSFLDQAMEYETLLREPHVGLALDPEWRLRPDQVHLRQIGSVDAAEVNAVADWLAQLVRTHRLPQKALVVHQFKGSMIANRPALALGYPELAPIIHVDGQGGQAAKDETYRVVTQLAPPAHVWWGWKNFYDEDHPGVRSPEATYAVEPRPVMISYQ